MDAASTKAPASLNDGTADRPQASAVRPRLLDIDTAKGIGIVLVVLGHVVSQQTPEGHGWYQQLKTVIYFFHMPFFMYLSGYVLGYTLSPGKDNALGFILKRCDRLLLPFFAFGLIIIAGKMVFSQFVFVDNTQDSLAAYLDGLFIHTARSPATSVWYLYAAFIYSAIFRLVVVPFPRLLPALILVSAAFTQFDVESLFYADRVLKHLVFFLIGVWVGQHREAMDDLLRRYGAALVVLFPAALALASWSTNPPTVLVAALASIPALHGLARWLAGQGDCVFLFFGHYTMAIYLFNTMCIGLVKGFGFLLVKWDGNAFYGYFIVLTAAGLGLPIVIRWIADRVLPPVARYLH
ncbi:acyltransferase family protein [Phreatobacter stygius]|uniref:Acyltransferase 3 domain-containing protein n=1 Tax=Phreatobacter stygius TaxID=1940610 RepID=A0A4D7BBM1_9HYPH|nr:acyltransferase family protein [Phreatobacter stygius]QCI68145.1 hypothetical protein E8M01_30285 [Phreatobacter stygius]